MSDQRHIYGDSHIPFPCEFPIKVMGYADDDVESIVESIVSSHLPENEGMTLEKKYSRNAKYVSITVTILAHSKPQLDAVYQDLSAHDKVLMAL